MATLPIEYEVLIPLFLGCFFSMIYESDKDEGFWAGAVATMIWIVTGLLYLIVSNYPSLALIFNGIGIIYIVRLTIAAFRPLTRSQKKHLDGDND